MNYVCLPVQLPEYLPCEIHIFVTQKSFPISLYSHVRETKPVLYLLNEEMLPFLYLYRFTTILLIHSHLANGTKLLYQNHILSKADCDPSKSIIIKLKYSSQATSRIYIINSHKRPILAGQPDLAWFFSWPNHSTAPHTRQATLLFTPTILAKPSPDFS